MAVLTPLLNYCATHPDATIHYQASNMVLWTHSNASYLTTPKGWSWAAGYYFLSYRPATLPALPDAAPLDNGPVHILCQFMHQVVASAAKAKLGALFLNAQAICPLRIALDELGHPQPATPLQTDNSMACSILNDMVKQKQSKAIDMCFYWLHDHAHQGQFCIFWQLGHTNRANYFTKFDPGCQDPASPPTQEEETELSWLPTFHPSDPVGHTFLLDPLEDGQRFEPALSKPLRSKMPSSTVMLNSSSSIAWSMTINI